MTDENKHLWIVDKVENNVAAIEVDGEKVVFVPAPYLPVGARDGDVFRVSHKRTAGRAEILIERDDDAKKALLERSRQQVSGPSGKDKGGNIKL